MSESTTEEGREGFNLLQGHVHGEWCPDSHFDKPGTEEGRSGAISDETFRKIVYGLTSGGVKRGTFDLVDIRELLARLDASEARAEAAEAERDECQRIAKGLAQESVPMLTDHLVVAESRLAAAYSALEAILEEAEYGSWTYALAFNALPDAQPQPTPSWKDEK